MTNYLAKQARDLAIRAEQTEEHAAAATLAAPADVAAANAQAENLRDLAAQTYRAAGQPHPA